MSKRKILVVSSSRADFYLIESLLKKLNKKKNNKIFLLLLGSHFIKNNEEEKKIKIKKIFLKKIKLKLDKDDQKSILEFLGKLFSGYIKKILDIKPHILVILGDRYEILPVAYISTILKIPIAHIHGGEKTEGSYDDNIRHSITKMSHLHFVTTNNHKKRIEQLGEKKRNVYNFGALGVENLLKTKLLNKNLIQKKLGIKLKNNYFLVTFHPVTLSRNYEDINNLLKVLSNFNDFYIIFTAPNIDHGNIKIIKKIKNFVKKNSNAFFFKNLGQSVYFSLMKYSKCVIGNSSSGIIEAPSLNIPILNIGDRQKGRDKSKIVVNCKNQEKDILKSLNYILSKGFLQKVKKYNNPYNKKNTAQKIANVISNIELNNLIYKTFNDK